MQSIIVFIHAHPLVAAAVWLAVALAADVTLGALDAVIRGEFQLDKLPQILKTKLVENVYARAILGLLVAGFMAQAQEKSLQQVLIGAATAAIALYSLPVSRDAILKLGFLLEDLYARLSGSPLPQRGIADVFLQQKN